jgi:alanine dehydrogenase
MGAEVVIMDINIDKLQAFSAGYHRAVTLYSSAPAIAREAREADLIIGSVLIPGALAPKLLRRETVAAMKPAAVIVDICIDQGGFAESSRVTSISRPTYVEDGVVHYCVPNMPALVPRTSTFALTNATLNWICALADQGIEAAIGDSRPLRKSVVSYQGKLTNTAIGAALGIAVTALETLQGNETLQGK